MACIAACSGRGCEDLDAQIWGDTTCYSSGYSEAAFRAIRRGQSMDEVKRALGEPLDTNERTSIPGETYWFYSRSCESDSYRERIVMFAPDGHVKALYAAYYQD